MDNSEIFKLLDSLFLEHTGRHLDTLQRIILQGSLDGKKYSEIADIYKCTEGHVRDEASNIWKTLSNIIGEDIHKSNFGATIDRLENSGHSTFINSHNYSHNFGVINFHESRSTKDSSGINNSDDLGLQNTHQKIIPRLFNQGLKVEQIAEILEISHDTVNLYINNSQ